MDLFCRQLPLLGHAVLVGQQAGKWTGPVPGVSPAGVLPKAAPPSHPYTPTASAPSQGPLLGWHKSISCAPKLPPHAQGAFRAEGWDLHSQSLRALSTDPSTCLCQLMEVIFTSFHLENRRQKSSNNFPGSRSIEEISLAHSQQVILRVLLRGDCSGSGCRAALGNLCVPHPHSAGHWDTQQGQTLPTLSFASPPSSLVPAL